MSNKSRKLMLVLALVAALAMLMAMTSISFAGGDEPTDNGKTVCVSGYVINHREQPVDGTKFDPVLTVVAEGAESPDVAPSVTVSATVGTNGAYTFKNLPAGLYYNFKMQLPADWDSIVPAAPR